MKKKDANMENANMGRVLTTATIESTQDLWAAAAGHLPSDRVRKIVVEDALVDTGATLL